jgi:AraC family transcriptional regulator, positive regulator of tynA and feaB
MTSEHTVRHWSTSSIPARMRLDFWLSTLQHSLWPVSGWSDVSESFHVEIREASLGPLSTIAQTITPHSSHRNRRDVERSSGDFYHLFFSDGPSWALSHRGRTEHIERGGAVLVGGDEHETCVPQGFRGLVLKCPADWIHGWVADPGHIVGRQIGAGSRWGRVLCPVLSQLTPELAVAPPVAPEALADHLGVILAMMAEASEPRSSPDLMRKAREYLQEHRGGVPGLEASEVAAALNVPTAVLHQALAAEGTSFLRLLSEAKVTS